MLAKDIIGKTITDIYICLEPDPAGLDRSKCFLEIDKSFFVKIPYSQEEEISVNKPDNKAMSFFSNECIEKIYHVNEEKKTVEEIVDKHRNDRRAFFRQLGGHLKKMASLDDNTMPKEYQPHTTEQVENKSHELKDGRIIDFIWDSEEDKKGLFLLNNGFLITETTVAPNGTGMAGLNYFENMEKLVKTGRYDYSELDRITFDLP